MYDDKVIPLSLYAIVVKYVYFSMESSIICIFKILMNVPIKSPCAQKMRHVKTAWEAINAFVKPDTMSTTMERFA